MSRWYGCALVLVISTGCSGDQQGQGSSSGEGTGTSTETGDSEGESDGTDETGETGGEEFPDCVPPEDPAPLGDAWIHSDSWQAVVEPQRQYLLEQALCTVTSTELIPVGDISPNGGVNLWMSCVRELDQVSYDDVVIQVFEGTLGATLAAMLGTDEFELRFEQLDWFDYHLQHTVLTLRSLEGELLFASANEVFPVTGVDDQGQPRWQLSAVAVPETNPAAVASWLEPFASIALVDDLCPIVEEPEENFVFDKTRRFALSVEDDLGAHLMFDRTAHDLTIDGREFQAIVVYAYADWRDDEVELAPGRISFTVIRNDL